MSWTFKSYQKYYENYVCLWILKCTDSLKDTKYQNSVSSYIHEAMWQKNTNRLDWCYFELTRNLFLILLENEWVQNQCKPSAVSVSDEDPLPAIWINVFSHGRRGEDPCGFSYQCTNPTHEVPPSEINCLSKSLPPNIIT